MQQTEFSEFKKAVSEISYPVQWTEGKVRLLDVHALLRALTIKPLAAVELVVLVIAVLGLKYETKSYKVLMVLLLRLEQVIAISFETAIYFLA